MGTQEETETATMLLRIGLEAGHQTKLNLGKCGISASHEGTLKHLVPVNPVISADAGAWFGAVGLPSSSC